MNEVDSTEIKKQSTQNMKKIQEKFVTADLRLSDIFFKFLEIYQILA